MRSVLPLPVAIQNATLLSWGRASAAKSNSGTWSQAGFPALNACTVSFKRASSAAGSAK